MTVLTAAQSALAKLVGRRPSAVVSSTDEICVEITALAQEAAVEIMKDHDWQALTEFYTITGDGAASAFPFPADYDRMVQATGLYDPNTWCWGYSHVSDYGEWMRYESGDAIVASPGVWNIRKNKFNFLPVPSAGQKAIFPYISKNVFSDATGAPKAILTADSDEFFLGDRILTLALIWKWLALKRMDCQQEIDDYNLALSQASTRDRGARVIRKGGGNLSALNAQYAYPWELG